MHLKAHCHHKYALEAWVPGLYARNYPNFNVSMAATIATFDVLVCSSKLGAGPAMDLHG